MTIPVTPLEEMNHLEPLDKVNHLEGVLEIDHLEEVLEVNDVEEMIGPPSLQPVQAISGFPGRKI